MKTQEFFNKILSLNIQINIKYNNVLLDYDYIENNADDILEKELEEAYLQLTNDDEISLLLKIKDNEQHIIN